MDRTDEKKAGSARGCQPLSYKNDGRLESASRDQNQRIIHEQSTCPPLLPIATRCKMAPILDSGRGLQASHDGGQPWLESLPLRTCKSHIGQGGFRH